MSGTEDERTPEASLEVCQVMIDPVRLRTYQILLGFGPQRVRELSKLVTVSEGSIRKHLRVMESIGFVAADAEESDPRAQHWRAIPGGLRLSEVATDPAYQRLMHQWVSVQADAGYYVFREWAKTEQNLPPHLKEAELIHDGWMRLTRDELKTYTDEIYATNRRWIDYSLALGSRADDPDVMPIYLMTNVLPFAREQ